MKRLSLLARFFRDELHGSYSYFLQYVLRALYASSKDSGIVVPSEHWFYLTSPGEPIFL